MPTWVSWLQTLWPIAATITPLIMIAGFYWLSSKFASVVAHTELKCEVDAHKIKLTTIDATLAGLERDADDEPTRMDLMNKLSALNERMSRSEAQSEALQRQMTTQNVAVTRELSTLNQYLHTLIERGIGK